MDKTVVVEVVLTKTHPKYQKTYTRMRRFKAHDEKEEYNTGDVVIIEATRPLSKEKRWKVISRVKAAKVNPSLAVEAETMAK